MREERLHAIEDLVPSLQLREYLIIFLFYHSNECNQRISHRREYSLSLINRNIFESLFNHF